MRSSSTQLEKMYLPMRDVHDQGRFKTFSKSGGVVREWREVRRGLETGALGDNEGCLCHLL